MKLIIESSTIVVNDSPSRVWDFVDGARQRGFVLVGVHPELVGRPGGEDGGSNLDSSRADVERIAESLDEVLHFLKVGGLH